MNAVMWMDITMLLLIGFSFFSLTIYYFKHKGLDSLFFASTLFLLIIYYINNLLQLVLGINVSEWTKLIAIIFYISGLLMLIRESKPVFARFPVYLTFLPFICILFFPLIIETNVIRNLINVLFQGGALLVTILVFAVNKLNSYKRRYYIIGLGLVSASYLSYWIYFMNVDMSLSWISEILLGFGLAITSFRFTREFSSTP